MLYRAPALLSTGLATLTRFCNIGAICYKLTLKMYYSSSKHALLLLVPSRIRLDLQLQGALEKLILNESNCQIIGESCSTEFGKLLQVQGWFGSSCLLLEVFTHSRFS